MPAYLLPITIEPYAGYGPGTVAYAEDGQPIDLTGWAAIGQVRRTPSGSVLAEFDCDIDAETGVITFSMSATETAKLQGTEKAFWDLLVTPLDGEPTREIYGPVTVSPAISRGA